VGSLLLALTLAGCGYSLRGDLPSHLETVAVPLLVNRTHEPGVENTLTGALLEAFATNGRLRVVDPARADAILQGSVVGYELVSIAYDPAANVSRYRLVITLDVVFKDVRRAEVIFAQQGLQERADFSVAGSVARTISREDVAVLRASVDIARSVVSRAVERF
jgi:hypothetical protein